MHEESGFEDLVLKNTTQAAMERFSDMLDWPQHLALRYPNPKTQIQKALKDYFRDAKGNWGIADFFAQCDENEIPEFIRKACIELKNLCNPSSAEINDTSILSIL